MNEDVKPENMRIHSRADELIACLEGEIAKRDTRIVELESQYQRDVYGLNNEGDPIGGDPAGGYASDNARLRSELAAIKAQEPVQVDYVAVMRDNGDGGLEPEWLMEGATAEMMAGMYLCCIDGGTLLFEEGSGQLYASPVSEAKAQGVVQWPDADEIMQMAFEEGQPADDASGYCFELEEFDLFIERLMSEVARLNAAPAQSTTEGQGDE